MLVAGVGILVLAFFIWAARNTFNRVSDFPEFYAPAKMIAAGAGSKIYDVDALWREQKLLFPRRSGMVMLFAPPFAIPLVTPLAMLPANTAPLIWKAFLLACLALSVIVLKQIFLLSKNATAWLIACLCLSGAIYEAIRIDQISTVLLLSFCLAIWALSKKRPYCAALAMSVMLLKPQLLLPFVVFLLGAKQYKPVLTLAVICLCLLAGGYAAIGAAGFSAYKTLMLSTINDNTWLQSDLSVTLRGQLFRLFPHYRAAMNYLTSIIFVIFLGWDFLIGRRLAKHSDWLKYGLVAIMPAGIVLAPYCYSYDLLLLLPTLIVLMNDWQKAIPPLMICAGIIGGLVFMLPFAILIHYDWIMKGHVVNPQFCILLIFAFACVLLFQNQLSKSGIDTI